MMSLDSGMLVVLTIVAMYMTIVFILLFHVKNEWCNILNSNLTVVQIFSNITDIFNHIHFCLQENQSCKPEFYTKKIFMSQME